MKSDNFIKILTDNGWGFKASNSKITITETNDIKKKLDKVPNEFLEFISSFDELTSAENNVWFVSIKDYYKEQNEDGFSWNEFELQSLEAAEDDKELLESINSYWNNHLPFMMSVKNEYAYVAIVLSGDKKGSIVVGNEPEYEESIIVANSLSEFFGKYSSHILNKSESNVFRSFV